MIADGSKKKKRYLWEGVRGGLYNFLESLINTIDSYPVPVGPKGNYGAARLSSWLLLNAIAELEEESSKRTNFP